MAWEWKLCRKGAAVLRQRREEGAHSRHLQPKTNHAAYIFLDRVLPYIQATKGFRGHVQVDPKMEPDSSTPGNDRPGPHSC